MVSFIHDNWNTVTKKAITVFVQKYTNKLSMHLVCIPFCIFSENSNNIKEYGVANIRNQGCIFGKFRYRKINSDQCHPARSVRRIFPKQNPRDSAFVNVDISREDGKKLLKEKAMRVRTRAPSERKLVTTWTHVWQHVQYVVRPHVLTLPSMHCKLSNKRTLLWTTIGSSPLQYF
jgi:hypothetical protein